ncbi:RNA guanylyltransferase and 5'-phosphatase mRNA capping enzyme [Anticarsia gemmatalis]|uniref:RNA guanylyltransferase and 5'-phosphatase mRNA capping enzyme n=1 Tax=Anticarsia gemmatalis TaxID=129554 RepID=UPI003F760D4E
MSHRDPGPIPNRWLRCPRKATGLVADKFLAFKTPLGTQFNDQVPEENRFTPAMLMAYTKSSKIKLGLWVDLTNTSRFYNKNEVEEAGCRYKKMNCRGHGETPSPEQTREFIQLVSRFVSQNPLEAIGVHCTHGFNRTGFLLVSYMVEQLDCGVEAAIIEFARIRPPGIYKQDYLEELCRRYGDIEDTPPAPPLPDWCHEEEDDVDDDAPSNSQNSSSSSSNRQKKGKGRKETTHKKDIFMPEVQGVEPFDTQPRLSEVQKKTQQLCRWNTTGFPGSQPVSMQRSNLFKLHEKPYRVSWKADGVRFMMLIDGEDEVYMLDRDNCVFKVHNLKFVHRDELTRHLTNTLLDGEMVIDELNGEKIPRYLCYDIISLDGNDVSKMAFYPTRLNYIEKEIVNPRHKAMEAGIILKDLEPFRVRLKQFWELPMARQLLGEKFAKQLLHEPDGLIFQPAKEPYMPGQCDDVLKWKPSHMNSVDFRLKIVVDSGPGILPTKVGKLFVGKPEQHFATMKVTKNMKHLDNKIIECTYQNGGWQFMRERTDKSFPNGFKTAESVCQSIKEPVTKEILLDFIDNHRFHDDSDVMPPPKRMRR